MEELEFKVGAKAAKLIGSENIADVDGALIELVKNAYDADAECVYIKYDMPFPNVPRETTLNYLEKYLNSKEVEKILKYYEAKEDKLYRIENIQEDELIQIKEILFSKNEIILIDNGMGMNKHIMRTSWMNIAISDKERNMYSDKGRIKTGAKGIGRFALEKLSTATQVFSKDKNEKLLEWKINWKQFDNAELLDEVKATLKESKQEYSEIIKQKIGEDEFKKIDKFNWNSGTTIIMTPIREEWTERLFQKVNTNMQSINPLSSVDTFIVNIKNTYDEKFNFESSNIEVNDYDYRIKAEFDGENKVKIQLKRNEVDLKQEEAKTKVGEDEYKFDLKDFWEREAFQKKNYHKDEFEKEIYMDLIASKEIKSYDIDKLKNVGPFSVVLYFLKNANSEDSIIKKVNRKKRKQLLDKFSGIKIYRDKFKVRPYGELEDGMYDWLNLGLRAQKSPAGIKHPDGRWRTLPYQTIGYVEIGREQNPKLMDMANREGLSTNDEYYIFVQLLQAIIDKFEFDRQYVYREYGKWLEEKVKEINKSERILSDIKKEKRKKVQEYNEEEDQYTKREYRETVYRLSEDNNREKNIKDILMSFSSAGIITNTFAHEFRGIETNVATTVRIYKKKRNKVTKWKGV